MNTAAVAERRLRFKRCRNDLGAVPDDAILVDRPAGPGPAPADAPMAPCPAEPSGIDQAIALWRAADLDLSPIVGRRGALAVLRRTLSLIQPTFDWLPAPVDFDDVEGAIACLREALAARQPDEAEAAAAALSTALRDLLSSLVGAALTEQVLRSVRAPRNDAGPELAGTRR